MDKGFKEPPIGVRPHSIASFNRITELNNAICRYSEFAIDNTISAGEWAFTAIADWAEEIKYLAEMEIKLLKRKKGE